MCRGCSGGVYFILFWGEVMEINFCPILTAAIYANEGYQGEAIMNCRKAHCAWWDEDKKMCAVKVK